MESLTLYPAYEGFDTGQVQHVDMKTWASSSGDKPYLATHGLGPCVGVAVYDPGTKRGWVGHFANPAQEQEELHAMFGDATASAGGAESLHVYVRGGQDSRVLKERAAAGELVIDTGLLNKETVAAVLERFHIDPANTDTRYDDRFWDDPGQQGCTRMLLDTNTGELHEWKKETGEIIQKVGQFGITGVINEDES